MATFWRKLQFPPSGTSEILIRLKDGRELIIYGYASIPANLPVIPWCPLLIKDEGRVDDVPYVQFKELREDTLKDVIVKFSKQKKLVALLLLAETRQLNEDLFRHLKVRSFAVIAVSLEYIKALKPLISSCSSSEVSVIPMLSSDSFVLPEQPDSCQSLFRTVCCYIRNDVNMSTGTDENGKRFLYEIMYLTQESITEKAIELFTSVGSRVLDVLLRRDDMNNVIAADFPIYFIVGELQSSDVSGDQRMPVQEYITKCMKFLSSAKPALVKIGLEEFLIKGDIAIVVGYLRVKSIFEYTADVCLKFYNEWMRNVKKSDCWIQLGFLCVSIALKLYAASKSKSGFVNFRKLWQDNIVNHFNSRLIVESDINMFGPGLSIMRTILGNHQEDKFGWSHVCAIFCYTQYSYELIRHSLCILCPFLVIENNFDMFIEEFLKPLTNKYTSDVFDSRERTFCSETVQEGILFVRYVIHILKKGKMDEEILLLFAEPWNNYLVRTIDLTHPDACSCIKSILCYKEEQTTFNVLLAEKIESHVKSRSAGLSITQFLALYRCGNFKSQVILQYLGNCRSFPESLRDNSVKELLEITSMRCEDAEQQFVLKFLEGTYENYSKKRCFLSDLVTLHTPKMFQDSMKSDFEYFLESIVVNTDVQDGIIDTICSLLDLFPSEPSPFYETVSKVTFNRLNVVEPSCERMESFKPIIDKICCVLSDHGALEPHQHILSNLLNCVVKKVVFSNVKHHVLKGSTAMFVKSFLQVHCYLGKYHMITLEVDNLMQNIQDTVVSLHNHLKNKSVSHDEATFIVENYSTYNELLSLINTSELQCGGLLDQKPVTEKFVCELVGYFEEYVEKIHAKLVRRSSIYPGLSQVELLSQLDKYDCLPDEVYIKLKKNIVQTISPQEGIKYSLIEDSRLVNIIELFDMVSKYLAPLKETSVETLLFSGSAGSEVLTRCLDSCWRKRKALYYYEKQQVMIDVNLSIEDAEKMMINILSGTASIYLIVSEFDDIQLTNEAVSLIDYIKLKNLSCDDTVFVNGYSAVKELMKIQPHLINLNETCVQFQLKNCQNDDNMTTLMDVVKQIESDTRTISMNQSVILLDEIRKILTFRDDEVDLCFQLLSAIRESAPLYNFAKERNICDKGTFLEQYQLVTAALSSESSYDFILNKLHGAMVVLLPVLEAKCSLNDLLTSISQLKEKTASMSQLKEVNSNIHLIKVCFESTQGETVQLVKRTLTDILTNGQYTFNFSDDCEVYFALEYWPFSNGGSSTVQSSKLTWDMEGISDFERKLEFFTSNDEIDKDFVQFTKSFMNVKRILKNYEILCYFGHAEFCGFEPESHPVSNVSNLEIKGEQTDRLASETITKISEYRNEYHELSLISIPKMRRLYGYLVKQIPAVGNIIEEISVLFKFDRLSRDSLIENLESKIKDYHRLICSSDYPPKAVGKFLHFLLSDSLPSVISVDYADATLSSNSASNFKLFTAYKFNNLELVCAIYHIFDGLPNTFQLLRCCNSTKEEEIQVFLDRVHCFPKFRYLILGVNKLSTEVQQVLIKLCSKMKKSVLMGEHNFQLPEIFFIEYAMSAFRNMPWITSAVLDKEKLPSKETIKKYCQCKIGQSFQHFVVVKGTPGSGKTFYIKKKIKTLCNHQCTPISVSEDFTYRKCIEWLRVDDPIDHSNRALYVNVSIFTENQTLPETLVETIHWFFFDYFLLGYVEDLDAGTSKQFPQNRTCIVFVEAPFWDFGNTSDNKLEESFRHFCETFPALHLLGTVEHPPNYIDIEGTSLICKYLKAYYDGKLDIITYGDNPINIGNNPSVTQSDCEYLLNWVMPPNIRGKRISEKLFLRYMERRCKFLETCPQLMYNCGYYKDKNVEINTEHMRSILFEIMIKEVCDFCQDMSSSETYQQVIYNFDHGGESFELFASNPELLSTAEKDRLHSIGVQLPTISERKDNSHLHKYLSVAFNIPLKNGRIELVEKNQYVLTKDFVHKMLNIHERKECKMPVIIEGETGVGKTFLLKILSQMWNFSWIDHIKKQQKILKEFYGDRLQALINTGKQQTSLTSDQQKEIKDVASTLTSDVTSSCTSNCVQLSYEKFKAFLSLKDPDTGLSLSQLVMKKMEFCRYDPAFASLVPPNDVYDKSEVGDLIQEMFLTADFEAIAITSYSVMFGDIKTTYFRLNIHAAITPEKIGNVFKDVTLLARKLSCGQARYERFQESSVDSEATSIVELYKEPVITVFLDEINTSSCLGFLKQIVIDGTINGQELPSNIFIIASCNPYKGNSVISLDSEWFKSSYNVHPLPPTLRLLKWDYSALRRENEIEYITEKLKYNDMHLMSDECIFLSRVIANGQKLVRDYAKDHLLATPGVSTEIAEKHSLSTVSQRDIQRVFTLYNWLKQFFEMYEKYEAELNRSIRAVFVSCAIVYYLRLNEKYRSRFEKEMNSIHRLGHPDSQLQFKKTLEDEIDWLMDRVKIPSRIAQTVALRENIYAITICTMNRIPIIIVGPPGSSKTLSFKIVLSNFQGSVSKFVDFRNEKFFKILNPYIYQCSRYSTSIEIDMVFKRAIDRQKTMKKAGINCWSVVLLDEADLSEEKHESLKALHYHLDRPKVAFVGITNHVLDAAKTNRAVCLFRPSTTKDDLFKLAEIFFPTVRDSEDSSNVTQSISFSNYVIPRQQTTDDQSICSFINAYHQLKTSGETENFRRFFGLRDFIHFLSYLYRVKDQKQFIEPKDIAEAVERNFNGKYFNGLVRHFLSIMGSNVDNVTLRKMFDILSNSIRDLPSDLDVKNEVRYKLLIESSEDQSLVRFLFTHKVLDQTSTKVLVCTKFPGDHDTEKIHTISSLCHCAAEGKTVLLINSDEIQESLYDLFNQRFTSMNCPENGEKLYFSTVTIGARSKLCQVSPNFQCVVVIKEEDLQSTEPAFLNRFEKYFIHYSIMLTEILSFLPLRLRAVIKNVEQELNAFIEKFETTCFYGFCESTLKSLLLSIFSSSNGKDMPEEDIPENSESAMEYLLSSMIASLVEKKNTSSNNQSFVQLKFSPILFKLLDLKGDANFISIMLSDDGLFIPEDVNEVAGMVNSGINWLLEDTNSTSPSCLPECSIVVKSFQKYIVLCLIKQMLAIMTPEAVVTHSEVLNPYFKQLYFKKQSHFSLASLLGDILQSSKKMKKFENVICFTRSTHALHEVLPNEYFWGLPPNISKKCLDELHDYLKLDPEDKLSVYRVLNSTTMKGFLDALRRFFENDSEIFLIVTDMREISTDVVNHMRILMDGSKYQYCNSASTSKIMVLLLHFPSSNFFKHCYPSVIAHGWRHHYLDNFGYGKKPGTINITQWLSQSFELTIPNFSFISDDDMEFWLRDMLPVISSYVELENFSNKHEIWKTLLFTHDIKSVLFMHFKKFWEPETMSSLSKKTTALSARFQSTLGISDLINSAIKSTFMDLVLYILSIANKYNVVQTLFCKQLTDATLSTVTDILKVIPIPSSVETLKAELMYLIRPSFKSKSKQRVPSFPFFHLIFKTIEGVLNRCNSDVCIQNPDEKITDETEIYLLNRNNMLTEGQNYCAKLICLMQTQLEKEAADSQYLVKALERINQSKELWFGYVEDLFSEKLKEFSEENVQMLAKRFLQGADASKLAEVHVHLRLHETRVFSPYIFSLTHTVELLKEYKTDDARWKEVLKLADEPDHQVKVFGMLIQTVFEALKNMCTSKHDPLEGCLHHLYRRIVNLHDICRAHLLSTPELLNEWILIDIGFNIKVHCAADIRMDFNKLFLLMVEKFATKDKEVLNIQDVFDVVCEIGFGCNSLPTPIPSSFPSFTDSLLNLFFVELEQIYSSDEESIKWLFKFYIHLFDHSISCKPWRKLQLYLKYYIKSVLQSREATTTNVDQRNVLSIFNSKARMWFGETINEELPRSDVDFLPIFYKGCPHTKIKTLAIDNHLADLYFKLTSEELAIQVQDVTKLTEVIAKYSKIEEVQMQCDVNSEKMLLKIEKQATVHLVLRLLPVTLRQAAGSELTDLSSVAKEIKTILDGQSVCINYHKTIDGPALIFTLRMWQASNSTHFFKTMMVSDSYVLREYDCLIPVHRILVKNSSSPNVKITLPLLEFITKERKELYRLYKRVCHALERITDLKSQSIKEMVNLAGECYTNNTQPNLKWDFNMLLLIATYLEIFAQKKWSSVFINFIHTNLSQRMNKQYCRILIWFADPSQTVCSAEVDEGLTQLRTYFKNADGCNNAHLKCLVQLAAVVMGCPESSSHLWAHLFNPSSISGYPLPGSLLGKNTIIGGKYYYSDVTNLEGDSLEYTYRSTLSIQSSSLIHWTNYGALCLSILVNPEIVEELKKNRVFPESFRIAEYCLMQLKLIWEHHLLTILHIGEDERDCLIDSFLRNLYKQSSSHSLPSPEALIPYETALHTIFRESWTETKAKNKFQFLPTFISETLRYLSPKVLPLHLSKEIIGQNFLHTVLSSTNLHSNDNELYGLYQFLLRRTTLNAGGQLLPHLIYFYTWIHDNLINTLTKEEAKNITLRECLDNFLLKNLPYSREGVLSQYEELTQLYADYKQKSSSQTLPLITADSLVYDFISFKDSTRDILLRAIVRIIQEYNKFLDDVRRFCRRYEDLQPISCENSTAISLNEITSSTCCVGNATRFDDLTDIIHIIEKNTENVSSECIHINKELDETLLDDCVPQGYDLWQIQCEIMKDTLNYKAHIDERGIKRKFGFKDDGSSKLQHHTLFDLINQEWLREHLKAHSEFTKILTPALEKEFKNLFHSIPYDALLRVINGFNILLKSLVKVLKDGNDTCDTTLEGFIQEYILPSNKQTRDLLLEVGIMRQSAVDFHTGITEDQYSFLCNTNMHHINDIAERLVEWLRSGMYDFCHLPYSMKLPISVENTAIVKRKFKPDDYQDLRNLTDLLLRMEQDITEAAHCNLEESIYNVLREKMKTRRSIGLLQFIPDVLSVQNYVYLHLILRRTISNYLETATIDSSSVCKLSSLEPINLEEEFERDLQQVTASDVSDLLKEMGLEEAAFHVMDQEIDGETIHLTPVDEFDKLLTEIGLKSACHRLIFTTLFYRKIKHNISDEAKLCPPAEVRQFFQITRGLERFTSAIENLKFDGEMLLKVINDAPDCLDELKLSQPAKSKLRAKFPKFMKEKLDSQL